jgi:hypothetical protein
MYVIKMCNRVYSEEQQSLEFYPLLVLLLHVYTSHSHALEPLQSEGLKHLM